MTVTDELRVIIEAEVERAVRDMERWEKTVSSSDQKLENIQRTMDRASRRMMLFSGAMAGLGVAGIKAAAGYERQEKELAILLGSASKAEDMFSRLSSLSASTPLRLGDVTKTAQDLLNFNVAADQVESTIRMLGDASRGNAAVLETVTRAYGRVQLKGKASMEELNMLTEAGIPILTELADQLGVATEELFSMVSAGQVSSADVQNAFIAMTSEGGRFHDMMKEVSETTEGKFSTALDNVKLTMADLAEEVLPLVNDVLVNVTYWAQSFRELDVDTKALIVRLIGIGVAAGPILKVSSGALGLYRNLGKLGPLMAMLGPSLVTPWGAAAAGIMGVTAAVTALIAVSNHTQKAYKVAEGESTGNLAKDLQLIDKEISRVDKNLQSLEKTSAAVVSSGGVDLGFGLGIEQLEQKLDMLKAKRAEILRSQWMEENSSELSSWYASEEAAGPVPSENVKKTWQAWFEEITEIAAERFGTSGSKAGRLYLDNLEAQFLSDREIGKLLGEEIDPLPYLEDQKKEIKSTLKELFSIDPDEINEAFTSSDSVVQSLVAKYGELSEAIAAARMEQDKLAESQALAERASTLVESLKTPYDIMADQIQEITDLQAAGHLSEAQALALSQQAWKNYQSSIAESSYEAASFHDLVADSISGALSGGIDILGLHIEMTKEAAAAYGELGAQLAELGLEATLDAFHELGAAMEDGKLSGEEFAQVMARMAKKILDQLPLLFLQAGLQLIVAGQIHLGLGFIFGGLASSIIAGYTDAKMNSAEASALGNVFSQGRMVKAFASGGAFTNSIVGGPTFFPMAAGGVGLMGEAGPEAVMPLTRTPGGELGVRAQGGGGAVYVVVNNYTGEQVQTRETEDGNGQRKIEVTIGSVVKGQIVRGEYDGALGGRYGMTPQGVRA